MEVDQAVFSLASRLRFTAPKFARGTGQGDRRGRSTGDGQEFADFRPYHPGDDLRRVDWNAYRRLESLLLRVSHEDRDQRVLLALDATGSMKPGGKANHAATLAAGLALAGLLGRDHVSLGLLAPTPMLLTGADVHALPQLLQAMQDTQPSGTADLRALLLAWARGRRFDRAVLLSDLLVEPDEAEQTLAALATISDQPTLLHVLAPSDIDPSYQGTLELEDAETGERLLIEAGSGFRAAYREAYTRWSSALVRLCTRYRITRLLTPTNRPAHTVLSDDLPRAGLVMSLRGGPR